MGYIIHKCTREYIYPVKRNSLEVKIEVCKSSNCKYFITFWNNLRENIPKRTVEMICFARDRDFDYYSCIVEFDEAPRYIRYFIMMDDGVQSKYLNTYGMQIAEPAEGFFEYHCTNENDVFIVPEWSKGAVMYQIFPERFCNGNINNDPNDIQEWGQCPTRENYFGGDIKGIIKKLDYINDLGVDVIYLTPIFEGSSNHKYDTVDYFKIDKSFGTLDEFKQLVAKAHELDIRIVLDGVFNHCGYYFAPFQDVLKNQGKSEYKDWFYVSNYPMISDPPNYECVGYYKWMPKLRHKTRALRDYILDVGEYWIKEADIDGWRLDVSDEVDFTLWHEFRQRIKSIKPDAILIGETWTDGRDLLRGDTMDAVMNYLFRDALISYIAKEDIDVKEFDNRIGKMMSIYNRQVYDSLYNPLGSHDTDRFLTICNEDINKMKLAIVFQMTFPGMPAIYYGDEIGMVGENDPDCRRCMEWDNQNIELKELYKRMISLRKNIKALQYGEFKPIICDNNVYGFVRCLGSEYVYIVINNNQSDIEISLPVMSTDKNVFSSVLTADNYAAKDCGNIDFYNDDIYEFNGYLELKLNGFDFEIIK